MKEEWGQTRDDHGAHGIDEPGDFGTGARGEDSETVDGEVVTAFEDSVSDAEEQRRRERTGLPRERGPDCSCSAERSSKGRDRAW